MARMARRGGGGGGGGRDWMEWDAIGMLNGMRWNEMLHHSSANGQVFSNVISYMLSYPPHSSNPLSLLEPQDIIISIDVDLRCDLDQEWMDTEGKHLRSPK